MDRRLARLQEVLRQQQDSFNDSMIGHIQPVLFEKPGRHAGQVVGRTPYLQPVHIDAEASDLVGRIVDVRIDLRNAYSFNGTPVGGVAPARSQVVPTERDAVKIS